MSNIAIIGGGQLGRSLKELIPEATLLTRPAVDITDFDSLSKALAAIDELEVVINTAAWTDVDGAETEEGEKIAREVNVDGVLNLVRIVNSRGLILVHISSDYVWDGNESDHLETEKVKPMGVYGYTKACGDTFAAQARHYIIRTSWLIGDNLPTDNKNNFVKTMANLAVKGVSPKVVCDQYGRLTFASELSKAILHLIQTKPEYGIYNVSNDGEVRDWCKLADMVFTLVGKSFPEMEVPEVWPISTREYVSGKDNIAPRPKNSDFNLDKIKYTGFIPSDYEPLLESYVQGLCKEFTQIKGVV